MKIHRAPRRGNKWDGKADVNTSRREKKLDYIGWLCGSGSVHVYGSRLFRAAREAISLASPDEYQADFIVAPCNEASSEINCPGGAPFTQLDFVSKAMIGRSSTILCHLSSSCLR